MSRTSTSTSGNIRPITFMYFIILMDFSLRQVEETQRIQTDYLRGQGEITPKMRSVLVDWLIGVHLQFHLLQETLYTTIAIIDRSAIRNHRKAQAEV